MKGTVAYVNPRLARIAVAVDKGGYSILALLDEATASVGDVIIWKGSRPIGKALVTNATAGTKCRVYFQDHGVTAANLSAKIGLR